MTKQIAFIFARGGSKGVRDKNIRDVAGKPLIAHTIETALSSFYINEVIVSTDSEEISRVAELYGASILRRPDHLATDTSSELLSWKHALELRGREMGGLFISLPATSPLRSVEDINNGIEKFKTGGLDILFGISPAHRNPFLNMVKIKENDLVEILISGSDAVRRQDVPTVFDITTNIYISNPEYIMTCEKLMEGRVGYIMIPTERSLDIDTEFDLYLADLILTHPFKGKKNEK